MKKGRHLEGGMGPNRRWRNISKTGLKNNE